ncbi:hypothetical protein GC173_01065 [bacterium]|nr:hypothetical protein [bacterium]
MSRLVQKTLVDRPVQMVPASRNRLIATFDCTSIPDFEPAAKAIQPLFQEQGFFYPLYCRQTAAQPQALPTNINLQGPIFDLRMALTLCDPKTYDAASDHAIAQFGEFCVKVGDVLTNLHMPKGWFSRRSSSASIPKMIAPEFDRPAADAFRVAQQYSSYLKKLPVFQRHLVLTVSGSNATDEEVSDFADFAEMGKPILPGVWRDADLGVVLAWSQGTFTVYMPSIPATWKPEVILDGVISLTKRFAAEFDGTMPDGQEAEARRLVAGWRNVLSPIGLQPGEDEAGEFFPAIANR